jgi:anti-sigma factor RsiW
VAGRATVFGVRTRTPQPANGVTGEQLVALADGTLSGPERAEVEARVAASPEATELLEAQRRSLAATRAFDPPLPDGFEPRVRRAATAPRPVRLRAGLAAACGAAVLILAIVLAPGERGATIAAMAAISARPAEELPAPAPAGEGKLQRSFAGVTFPDWDRAHGWRAVGARRDQVDGRATETVYYFHTHHRIGYTVLSGSPVALPWRGRRVERDGVQVQLYRDGPRTVAVFERAGRTCVLAGVVHREETLVKLATWRAGGALRF